MAAAPRQAAPEACDLLIDNAVVMTLDPADTVIADGAVVVHQGHIAAVGDRADVTARYRPETVIDAGGAIVHPGFIEAHVHITQYTARSVLPRMADTDLTMGHWKGEITAEDEYASTALAAVDLLKCGYTAFVDPGTVFEPDAAAAAATDIGIRAWLTDPYVADRPDALAHRLPALVSDSFLKRWPKDRDAATARLGSQLHRNAAPNALVRGYVGLYGEDTASPDLHRAALDLARHNGVQFQQHLGYEPHAYRQAEAALGGSLIAFLDAQGLLAPDVTFVHMNVLRPEDIAILARCGVALVWCPYGQLGMMGHGGVEGRMPEAAQAGIAVGLASDIARCFNFDDLGTLAMLAAGATGRPATPQQILRMRTLGAAATIGAADQLGSIEPGKLADIVIHRPDCTEDIGIDRAFEVALLGRRASIDTVLVAGRRVVSGGRVLTIDEGPVIAAARRSARGIAARIGLG